MSRRLHGLPFTGTVLVVAPHMDDETLGCGALIAGVSWRDSVHVAFATDGRRSPVQRSSARAGSNELIELRQHEALQAMTVLGVSRGHVHFLGLPDGELASNMSSLRDRLVTLCARLQPSFVLVPFRYDRHPDHLAVNRVATHAVLDGPWQAKLVEYFVYVKWRMLPAGDVRAYLAPDQLVVLKPGALAEQKRRALDCYRTQTTRFYDWQQRPILTPKLLDTVCQEPEMFLFYDAAKSGTAVFNRARGWIRLAHRLEPVLKRSKDQFVEWLNS